MTSERHVGLTKHHSHPTPSFYLRVHQIETWADVFQKLLRQISGSYKCVLVTHCRGSSPVCPLERTNTHTRSHKHTVVHTHIRDFKLFWPCSFSQASQQAKVKLSLPGWVLGPLAPWVTVGKGRLQSQLASQRTIKTDQACCSGKTFLAQTPHGGFFPIRQFREMGGLKKKRKKASKKSKPNLPTPKIFALLRKTKVIWFLFELIFWWHTSLRRPEGIVEQTHNLSLTGKLPNEV